MRRLRQTVAMFATVALGASLLTVITLAAPIVPTTPAEASPPASSFDPGLIISDSTMFDFGTMSVSAIQSFLDSKVSSCSTQAEEPCLKSYKADITSIPGFHDSTTVKGCKNDLVAKANQTAAAIIYAVAQACQVNPKVILVTLQKEQGLVTSTSPTSLKYRHAMGAGCPDSSICDKSKSGFFAQLYWGARSYVSYYRFPGQNGWNTVGKQQILYHPYPPDHPELSCGTKTVNIKSQATAGLYTYTPYTPNPAALANLSGTGDKCSSYGNRNFWVYFNNWFGSAIGGSFIVTTPAGETYLLVNGAKWLLPSNRSGLVSTLAPLGKPGAVSGAYASSLPTGGQFSNLILDSTGAPFLLDNGRRMSFSDCAQAADFGYDCATAPTFPDAMASYFPVTGAMTSFVNTSAGAMFFLTGGHRREILDMASVGALGIALPAPTFLLDDSILPVPLTTPISRPNVLIAVRGTSYFYYSGSTANYQISGALLAQLGLAGPLGNVVGVLNAESMGGLPNHVSFQGLFMEPATGTYFVATPTGKSVVRDPAKWGAIFVPVDDSFSSRIPATGQSLATPLFVKNASTGLTSLLKSGELRPAASTKARARLAVVHHAKNSATLLAGDTVAALGPAYVKLGSIVKSSKKSKTLWLITGVSTKKSISASVAKELRGTSSAKVLQKSTIDGFSTSKGSVKPGLKSGTSYYIADNGWIRKLSTSDFKRYGSKLGFNSYSSALITSLKKGGDIGHMVKSGSTYYEIKSGKKKKISSATAKKSSKATHKTTQTLSKYVLGLLPTK